MMFLTVRSSRHERRMVHDSKAARARRKPASGSPSCPATMPSRCEMLWSAICERRRSGCGKRGWQRKQGSAGHRFGMPGRDAKMGDRRQT